MFLLIPHYFPESNLYSIRSFSEKFFDYNFLLSSLRQNKLIVLRGHQYLIHINFSPVSNGEYPVPHILHFDKFYKVHQRHKPKYVLIPYMGLILLCLQGTVLCFSVVLIVLALLAPAPLLLNNTSTLFAAFHLGVIQAITDQVSFPPCIAQSISV